MSKVYAISNQKGGVAKTVTAINLATYLAAAGRKVMLIDLDPQGDATVAMGIDPEKLEKHAYHFLIEDDIKVEDVLVYQPDKFPFASIPTNIDLSGAESDLLTDPTLNTSILRNKLELVRPKVDYIIIDCPPSLGALTVTALVAADGVIIPCQTHFLSYRGLYKLKETIAKVKARLNPALQITAIIPTLYDSRTRHDNEILTALRANHKDVLLDIPIPRLTVVADSISSFVSIEELDPHSPAALAYKQIAEHIHARS